MCGDVGSVTNQDQPSAGVPVRSGHVTTALRPNGLDLQRTSSPAPKGPKSVVGFKGEFVARRMIDDGGRLLEPAGGQERAVQAMWRLIFVAVALSDCSGG